MSLLNVDQISKSFRVERGLLRRRLGVVTALDGVSFNLEMGDSMGLVGESGSGKSTLAWILAGFLRPDAGGVSWEGQPQARFSRGEWAARVQMIFQDPAASLNPKLTVRTLLAEPVRQRARWQGTSSASGRALEESIEEVLEAVGLPADAAGEYPHAFSGGQRQRIAIARALAARPRLLIADEPVSALDLSVQAQILNLLAEMKERFKLSLVLISHDLTVVRQMTDHVLILDQGRVVERGSTEQVLASPVAPVTKALLAAVPALLR